MDVANSKEGAFTNLKSGLKKLIFQALNPASVLRKEERLKWHLLLLFPASGWFLFFLQVGIERYRQLMFNAWNVIAISLLGFIFGYVAVGLAGWLISFVLAQIRMETRMDQVISLIAMSHTYMVVSMILGLIYNLFGNSSSASFGIPGLMCTLLPIYSGIRSLGKGKAFLPPLLATATGVMLIFTWQLILAITG
jgi:hypothetical protein